MGSMAMAVFLTLPCLGTRSDRCQPALRALRLAYCARRPSRQKRRRCHLFGLRFGIANDALLEDVQGLVLAELGADDTACSSSGLVSATENSSSWRARSAVMVTVMDWVSDVCIVRHYTHSGLRKSKVFFWHRSDA